MQKRKTMYAARGVRSMSEFARDAMMQFMGQAAVDGRSLEDRIQFLNGKLAILEGEVARLSRVVSLEAGDKGRGL